MRAALITFSSLMLTASVIGNAFYQKRQFYPSVVYITKSNPSMAIIYLQSLVFVVLMGELVRKVFFGQLRAAEQEHLIDRSWYVMTETCLAFTIFRDDFSPKFVALFTLLLFLKCFHWLADDRVDYMERSPVISAIFHLRVVSLLLVLASLDIYLVSLAYHSTLTKGASVQLVFGFEYAILVTIVVNILIKYILHTIDLHRENPWENKAVFLLYTELAMGFIKVVLYVLFVAIMIKIHSFPLFVIRPMYITIRAFKKAFNDVIMSRRAIRNMNTLYPDVTPEELAASDNVCIICREEMVMASKRLPCNHIFHTSCLRSWFQRQQTCPTCRMDVLRMPSAAAAAMGNAGLGPRAQRQQPDAPRPMAPQVPGVFGRGLVAGVQQGPVPQNAFGPGVFIPPMPEWFAQFQYPQPPVQPAAVPTSIPPTTATTNENSTTTNAGTGATTVTSTTGTSTTTSNATPHGTPVITSVPINSFPILPFPPFLTPPFAFPPFIPPPLPPAGFLGLTDEELRAMEGQERQHVEARIQCLRNIQTLLDAAVLQMQQYSGLVATLRTRPPTNSNSTQPPQSTSQATSQTTTELPTDEVQDASNNETEGAVGFSSQPDDVPSTAAASNSPEDEAFSEPCDEQEQLRRRRLHRFAEQAEGNASSKSSD